MTMEDVVIGDLFFVNIDKSNKKYFQYIANDLTQLNSDVIRAFSKIYPIDANPDLLEIVNADVEFYAHCVTKWGLKLGLWKKEGNIQNVGEIDHILFRSSGDEPKIKTSNNWWIWKINEPQKQIGRLTGENKLAEIGSVIPPDSIVHRIRTGEYDFVYPDFE